jgi:hypothetical protein
VQTQNYKLHKNILNLMKLEHPMEK